MMLLRMLLLLVTSHVAECQSTTAVDSKNCQFDEQQTNALFNMKNEVTSMKEQIQTELRLVREQIRQVLLAGIDDGTIRPSVRPRLTFETQLQCRNLLSGKKPGTPTIMTSLTGINNVAAIALLKDQLFVSRSGVAQVSVYNATTFQLQRQLTFTGLGTSIRGLATCPTNNYLYISDDTNRVLHRVDLSVADANTLIKWNVAQDPHGLSVNSARNVLVAYFSTKKVQEYTPTGSLVREISDSNQLWQAVELSSGLLAVSQRGPLHGVSKISLDTQFWRHSYGNQAGSGAGQMNNPSGLSLDNNGYILVADFSNHRILVMNPCLTDTRQLPLPVDTSLQFPVPLVLDYSRGRLYVGEWGGQNRLLVFNNVTNLGSLFDN